MAFDAYSKAGFTTELLPILPPGATISAASKAKANLEVSRGKVPGKRRGSEWVGFANWAQHETTESDVALWSTWGSSIGLQGRVFPGLDIDIEDVELADAVDITAALELGLAPTRFGRGARRLRIYAGAGFKKRRLAFRLPARTALPAPGREPGPARDRDRGEDDLLDQGGLGGAGPDADPGRVGWTLHAVELLGDGQQYVVEGIHPKTLAPYHWAGGVSAADVGVDGLAEITPDEVDRFFELVAWSVENIFDGEIIENAKGANGAGGDVDQDGLEAPSLDEVERALQLMGNEE